MQELTGLIRDISDGARAAHAFAVEGRAGEARGAFIQQLAQGLECQAPEAQARPCGVCPSCRQISAGTSLDVVHMNKSAGSGKSAPSYKVDDASAFIERLGMGKYGRFLIGIIDDADTLSEVVQNKLLKTLEEPGRDTIILLGVSNRDNLLSTVRSRCSDIRMSDYGDEAPGTADQGRLSLVRLLTDPKTPFYEYRAALDKSVRNRDDALAVLEYLEDELHAQLRAAAGGEPSGLSPQEASGLIELAAVCRMDIRRDMAPAKALRRLFLDFGRARGASRR